MGEVLGFKVSNVDTNKKKIDFFPGRRSVRTRAVSLSDDAFFWLGCWLAVRDQEKEFVFYDKGYTAMCFTTARASVGKYLRRAGLADKGHTAHSLRHAFVPRLVDA
jgi:site-specific recombinase XerD